MEHFSPINEPLTFFLVGLIFALSLSLGALLVVHGRSKKKIKQQILAESNKRFHDLANTAPLMIWISDRNNECVFCNQSCLDFSGRTIETELGFGWMDLIHPEDRDRCFRLHEEAAAERKEFVAEFRIMRKDGQYRWLLEWGKPKYDFDGNFDGFIGSSIDIQQRKEVEQRWLETQLELQTAKEAAESANQTKSRFIAAVSHELRTPLTAILGFAEILRMESVSDDRIRQRLDPIERNAQLLLSLVNDVLDLSKIEADSLEIESRPILVEKLMTDVTSALNPQVRGRNLLLSVENHIPSGFCIVSDPLRLQQILLNLIGNAVKFSEQGEVVVSAQWKEGSDEVTFAVKDTGPGIDRAQCEKLFEPFAMLGKPHRRKAGTGLGLYLSRRLARAMGGDVKLLETQVGKGSTFALVLPKQAPVHGRMSKSLSPPSEVPQTASLRGLKLLVVEDGDDNRALLKHRLKAAGATVELAEDGLSGVSQATKDHYDVILMDLQMPGLNGYEATTRLRQKGYAGPIVAISAGAFSGEAEKSRAAGCNEFVPKPLDFAQLVDTVSRLAAG